MTRPSADSNKGDDNRPSSALFQGAAEPPSGGGRTWLVVGALVVVAGAVFGIRALVKKDPPPPVAPALPPPPKPLDVPDGAMVRVTGATYQMGSNEGDPDEKPITEVTVQTFEIDATEVTVGAYAKCVAAGKCGEPDTGMYCNWKKPDRDRHPVNCVDFKGATDYCAFAGKRLPTEEEWELAARGTDGRVYPWKDGAPAAQLCWNGEGNDQGKGQRQGTCPVASYPAGRSPAGAFDMAGNVWEWTASAYCPYDRRGCADERRVIRGGGVEQPPAQVRPHAGPRDRGAEEPA
jgi:formylglycine-generating enzyme required for sulfatase activity